MTDSAVANSSVLNTERPATELPSWYPAWARSLAEQYFSGTASVFVPGSTAAVTAMEYEPGGVNDLKAALERLIPAAGHYEHNRLNNDTNSHAHIRAAIVGPSETVPVRDGRLALGTWQQLVLVDFDDRPRQRTVVVQVIG